MQQGKKSPSDRRPSQKDEDEEKDYSEREDKGPKKKKIVRTFGVKCSMCLQSFQCPETEDGDNFLEDLNRGCVHSDNPICKMAVGSKSNTVYLNRLAKTRN